MEAYDERGNMIYERTSCILPEPYTEEKVYYGEFEIEDEFREYLWQYVFDCAEKKVSVYFTVARILDEAIVATEEDIETYTEC